MAVDEWPTWTTAADAVGVSPSALSQGLAELERRLGVDLFDRSGRRRVLREQAAPVLDHARQVIGLTSDLARWAERERSGRAGRIRVGMIDAAATIHLVEPLHEFRRERPDVDLRLTVAPSGDLFEDLVAGRLDLAIAVAPPTTPDTIETRHLLREDLSVYAPRGAATGDTSQWGPWVLFPEGSHTRAIVGEALRSLGAPVEVVAESHQPDVLAEMVDLGIGWTVLPSTQARRHEPALDAVQRLASRTLVSAWRRGSVRSPAAVTLVERLSPRD